MASWAMATSSSAGRGRTGRRIMPAWQKRQPRVQPRMISSVMRSWTVSTNGTIRSVGKGTLRRDMSLEARTRSGRPSCVGRTAPSGPGA